MVRLYGMIFMTRSCAGRAATAREAAAAGGFAKVRFAKFPLNYSEKILCTFYIKIMTGI